MADELRARIRPERLDEFDSWRSLGMSEAGALEALRGHEPASAVLIEGDGFDRMADQFQALGLTETAARTATTGREYSEAAARATLKAPAPAPKADAEEEPVPTEDPTAADQAAADATKVKAPAKKAAAKKAAAKKAPAKATAVKESAVARHEARGLTFLEALAAAEAETNPRVAGAQQMTIHETNRRP